MEIILKLLPNKVFVFHPTSTCRLGKFKENLQHGGNYLQTRPFKTEHFVLNELKVLWHSTF